jgi:hypothetical protein
MCIDPEGIRDQISDVREEYRLLVCKSEGVPAQIRPKEHQSAIFHMGKNPTSDHRH